MTMPYIRDFARPLELNFNQVSYINHVLGNPYSIIMDARQTGKSLAVDIMAGFCAAMRAKSYSEIAVPTNMMSKHRMSQCADTLSLLGQSFKVKNHEILMTNGSVIHFRSGFDSMRLRGHRPFDYMFIEDFSGDRGESKLPEFICTAQAKMRKGAKMCLISSPNGYPSSGEFGRLLKDSMHGNSHFKFYFRGMDKIVDELVDLP